MLRSVALALSFFAMTTPAWADMAIADIKAKRGIGPRPGVVHMLIKNMSDRDDQLVSVTSPQYDRVELHTHEKVDNIMRMRKVAWFDIKAREEIALEPGGKHLMLFGPRDPEAQVLVLIFTFKHAEKVTQTTRLLDMGRAMRHGRNMKQPNGSKQMPHTHHMQKK